MSRDYETDDVYHNYCRDNNFFILCGPGAADIALWYWPNPPSLISESNVVDPRQPSTSTTWFGTDIDGTERMRGYLAYLAWQMEAQGWTQPGILEQYAPGGTRLQEEEEALNWEETGHQTNTAFYVVEWHWDKTYNPNGGTQTIFHQDVVDDIYYNLAPVVVEVNAQLLPNWPDNGSQTLHYITVLGYSDNFLNKDGSYGEYYYTDTCANLTHCGSNSTGSVLTASYNKMWTAIMGAPYSPSTGDGGWIW